jgi:carboxypeptidase Taq
VTLQRPFEALLPRVYELRDLSGVVQVLTWDQETYLPKKAMAARGAQLTTLQGLYHERLVDPRLGDLLESASAERTLGEDERALLREVKRERDRAVKIPERLVRALADAQTEGLSAWRQAREENRFARMAPALTHLLLLRREEADACAVSPERYDALLDRFEPGMNVARLGPILKRLADRLVPAVQKIADRGPPQKEPWEERSFDVEKQWTFTLELLAAMGFDLEAGRQDRSIHPFTSASHSTDVRLTTRLDAAQPLSAFFSTLHEGGHGLYEQGFDAVLARTPLAQGASMGLHESQSRLWENQVGRSRAFWQHFLPRLRGVFPEQLNGVDVDGFYRAINRVQPSLIRTEADEVTYNLHIILRFELEVSLLRGTLRVEDLPEAWNDGMQRLLGVRPSTDVEGVLQDIHWSYGEFGYFPTYTLGNLYSASLFMAARKAMPRCVEDISRGQLSPLLSFLRQNIHRHGMRTTAEERVQAVTGKGLTDEDFVTYLREKFGELYGLEL